MSEAKLAGLIIKMAPIWMLYEHPKCQNTQSLNEELSIYYDMKFYVDRQYSNYTYSMSGDRLIRERESVVKSVDLATFHIEIIDRKGNDILRYYREEFVDDLSLLVSSKVVWE